MSKVDRNAPQRSTASESRYTLEEFNAEFPDDEACLAYLVVKLYPAGIHCPKCGKVTPHHRLTKRPAFSCQFCGRHEYPMSGTIFQDSATSLRLWFYAIYLMASTRCGISAKQIERELGVTYKCAWRMFNKIRSLLTQKRDPKMGGQGAGAVEMDEAYIGGIAKWRNRGLPVGGNRGGQRGDKTMVHGIVERGTNGKKGRVSVQIVKDGRTNDLLPIVVQKVLPKSTVYTDEWKSYDRLGEMGHRHERVHHSMHVYVSGDCHVNTIEGFWSLVKRGISGVYHGVSTKHLQSYLDEYVFRFNQRDAAGRGMFDAFLSRIEKTSPAPSASAAKP